MPAFYITLQEKIPGVDATVLEGHALSKHNGKLEALAKQTGVIPLMNFFSADKEEVAGLVGESGATVKIPEEKWFPAEDGLGTIAALLRALADPRSAEDSALSAELKEFQDVLLAARSRNIRWHLGIDY
jgi:hypothetical protein